MRKILNYLNSKFFLKLLDKSITWVDPKYRYKLRFFRRYFLNYEKINLIDVGSYGGFLYKFNKKNISSPKLNTILKTYGLLSHKDGIY